MPAELVHDEDYMSEEDSDFAPGDAPGEESTSSDEDEAAVAENPPPGKRKRHDGDKDAEGAGFENSGDEAIIEKGKKRQKILNRKDGGPDGDEDEGGEGGLIKTRRMRAAEKAEKQVKAASGPVTIDVDALWAQMTSEPVVRKAQNETATTSQPKQDAPKPSAQQSHSNSDKALDESNLIRIKRTYNFAGEMHTEEKLVPRDSAEAKLYLAENGGADSSTADGDGSAPTQKRMPRKAFRSAFEPVAADGVSPRTDLNLGMSARLRARELAKEAEAKKLNTVEKSRMDWAGFVDREGIKDELELAGKSKHSFAARQEFLARSEAIREEEARRLRMAERG
ncbi:bucentaur or craniofacial development-domain-containing protein [Achaetomium macrosporum]|uniref:SWR1-complex protein 5 n=1 Tax=Achaetomium macrosporum TaxID=79813 RepID=A0AAN7CH68_9PEZI|nr:bucentaur or craniofacial development-domain-containing protein [Achaetomium macrosporum]